jgi:hypothetical protein
MLEAQNAVFSNKLDSRKFAKKAQSIAFSVGLPTESRSGIIINFSGQRFLYQ